MSEGEVSAKPEEGARKGLTKPAGRGLWRLPRHLENTRLRRILFLMPIFQHPARRPGAGTEDSRSAE